MSAINLPMGPKEIQELLPHRFPMLLLDRVTEIDVEAKTIKGFKNLTINESFFQGHFPGQPIMPGVLILEAMAQLTGVLGFSVSGNSHKEGYLYLFAGIDNVRFKQSAYPGDCLQMEAQVQSSKRGIHKVAAQAYVDGRLICSADIICAERKVSE